MFSNLLTMRLFTVLIAALLISACAKENEPGDAPIEIAFKSDKTQCLNEIGPTFDSYLNGNISESKLKGFWECTRDAIQMFLDVTKGKRDRNAYSSHEIKRFLEEYFLDGYALSPALIEQVMRLKNLMVGGSISEITREELTEIQVALVRIENITLDLLPHMYVVAKGLMEPSVLKVEVSEVEAAEAAVRVATHDLALILSENGQDYTLKHLEALIVEVIKATGAKNNDDSLKNIRRYFPLVQQAKNLLVDKNPTSFQNPGEWLNPKIESQDWVRLMDISSNLLGYFLRYRIFVEQGDWRQGKGLDQIHHIVTSAESVVRQALNLRSKPYYDVKELVGFVETLRSIDMLPLDIDKAAVEVSLKVLVNKLLAIGSEPFEVDKFSISHLNQLRSEYWRWYSAQQYIQSFGFVGFDFTASSSDPAIEEMRKVLSGPWALVQDSDGRLLFNQPQPNDSDIASRTLLNLERAAIRILILAYAEDADRVVSLEGLTETELLSVETDLHSLLEALGLVKAGESIAGRMFIEANLFMPRSNGDDILNFEEGIEYFSFVLSGLSASGIIFEDVEKQCPVFIEDNETKVAIDCFRSKVSEARVKYLKHLPNLLNYLDAGTTELWSNIEINLERAIRDDDLTQPITRGEALKMWVLLQYMETFFARFDSDKNSTVNLSESLESYEVFRRTLEGILTGALSDEDGVLAFFTFSMRYGETPFNATWGGELKFLNWKWSVDHWNYEAHRLRVLKILAALNELL